MVTPAMAAGSKVAEATGGTPKPCSKIAAGFAMGSSSYQFISVTLPSTFPTVKMGTASPTQANSSVTVN